MKSNPERKLIVVNEVIREMLRLLRNELARHSITIETRLAEDIPHVRSRAIAAGNDEPHRQQH